jgi:hypothetical protein
MTGLGRKGWLVRLGTWSCDDTYSDQYTHIGFIECQKMVILLILKLNATLAHE